MSAELSDARAKGERARRGGRPWGANPYRGRTAKVLALHAAWRAGWEAAACSADWDARFLALAEHVAAWSKDPSTQVGAVIVDPDRRVVSTGFNGWPRGAPDDEAAPRDVKLHRTLHAEVNAVLFARRDLTGCTLYVSCPPCSHCMAVIVQAGIGRVVTREPPAAFAARWRESLGHAARLADETGVMVVRL